MMETAFLLVTAANRDFDLSKWFNEKFFGGRVPVREFDAKIVSLSNAMGINQDLEIKRELEIATSPLSLRVVHTICACGEDSHGELLIDFHYLFRLAQEKVDHYLAEMQDAEEDAGEKDLRSWQDGEYDIHGRLITPASEQPHNGNGNRSRHEDEDVEVDVEDVEEDFEEESHDDKPLRVQKASSPIREAQEYLSDIQAISQSNVRPVSASAGPRAQQRGETIEQVMRTSRYEEISLQKTKNKRYDEVASLEESIEEKPAPVGTAAANASSTMTTQPSHKPHSPPPTSSPTTHSSTSAALVTQKSSPTDWTAENRRLLFNPAPASQSVGSSQRPRSADPSRRQGRTQVTSSLRSRSVDHEMRRLAALVSQNFLDRYTPRRSTSSLNRRKPAPTPTLTKEQENYFKDVVEDSIRNCVKKADLYHLVQVNLGFIDSYTMIPPRGTIVISQPTLWIPINSIQTAFLAGRVHLNSLQVHVLTLLLQDFARDYPSLYPSEPVPQSAPHPAQVIPEPKTGDPVLGTKGAVSAAWLRKYLIHLRLTKRRQSFSAQSGVAASASGERKDAAQRPVSGGGDSNAQTRERRPTPWQDWLNRKVEKGVSQGPHKSKELQKALLGLPHNLTREDIRLMLTPHVSVHASMSSEAYSDDFSQEEDDDDREKPTSAPAAGLAGGRQAILPPELLEQDINNRIQLWALDSDGRRDFQHQLNIKVRTYIHRELFQGTQIRPAKGETVEEAYWARWLKVEPEQRKEIKSTLMRELFDEKREKLRSEERNQGRLTIELFELFSKHNQERTPGMTWVDWLSTYMEKTARHIAKLKEVSRAHKDLDAKQKKRKQSMASLLAVEAKVKDLCATLDTAHQVQVQKGLVALRKAAQSRGTQQVVTKEDFDRHIRAVLAPYVAINETFLEDREAQPAVEEEASKPNEWTKQYREKLVPLFENDPQKTVDNILAAQDDKTAKNSKSYSMWLTEKKQKEVARKKKQVRR